MKVSSERLTCEDLDLTNRHTLLDSLPHKWPAGVEMRIAGLNEPRGDVGVPSWVVIKK
jgi:hypothetical protein